jgi:hypothetical protein
MSWFARLQDLDHKNNQEFDHKKKWNENKKPEMENKLVEAHLYDVFKILVSSAL